MESLREILNRQADSTTTNLQKNIDTYIGDDGLVYCSKCNTLRETENIIPVFGRRMPIRCKCMKEASEKNDELEDYRKKMLRLDKLRSASLLGERYKDKSFDNTDKVSEEFTKAMSRCKKYCDISDIALEKGYGIYIYGKSGTGKTHLTACMCNELISQYKQCLFTNFFEITKLIKATFGSRNSEAENIIKRICEIDFLFLDDLGTESLKKNGEDNWLQEQVYDIINKRYNNIKPTIFTSNYSLNELVAERGMMDKTVDRIMEMSTAIIKLSGESYRARNRRKENPF